MKTMYYTNGQNTAIINKVIKDNCEVFRVALDKGEKVIFDTFENFWDAETFLVERGYRGTKDATYKGVEIRWRERGIHNVLDMLYKDGYYSFVPPFPGTIYYDAATIEEAKAEIDRLEELSKC